MKEEILKIIDKELKQAQIDYDAYPDCQTSTRLSTLKDIKSKVVKCSCQLNQQTMGIFLNGNFEPKQQVKVEPEVKTANGGQIYLLYKRLLGYSDMTPVLVAVFDDVEKALDQKYRLQKDDHANSYFIEDSRLSVGDIIWTNTQQKKT